MTKVSKTRQIVRIGASDDPSNNNGAVFDLAKYRTDLEHRIEEVRRLRAEHSRRSKTRSPRRKGARLSSREQTELRLKKWNRQNSTRYTETIKPCDDATRDIRWVQAQLGRLVAGGMSITLTHSGCIAIERTDDPIPDDAVAFIRDCEGTVVQWLRSYYRHRDCPRSARPTLIAGERFAVRCSACFGGLRRKTP